jgi:hypothetical protein
MSGAARSGGFASTCAFCHTKKRSLKSFPTTGSTATARVPFATPRTYEERSNSVSIDLGDLGFLASTIRTSVVAGNVNSGQLAIRGPDQLSASCSGG